MRVQAQQRGVAEVLLARVQSCAQGSARGTAEQPQRRREQVRVLLPDVGEVLADAVPLALCAEDAVARGERRALGMVGAIVGGLGSFHAYVPERQVTRAGAVPQDADVLQVPLVGARAVLVEDLQGERAERCRALGAGLHDGSAQPAGRLAAQ
ncbi:hypothetical protein [Streptomyces sp. NPDC059786]|uniref:hypothetical protein n=1 Tax=Streptomyces sp. NPDC059786 TaxID=3346946 RepID=UPI00366A24CE